jgi:hypothetical protein
VGRQSWVSLQEKAKWAQKETLAVFLLLVLLWPWHARGQAQLSSPVTLKDPNPQAGAIFGRTAAVGDINGDGWADVLIGAPASLSPPASGTPTSVADDLDGDGSEPQGDGQAFVFLGPDLTTVLTLDNPLPQKLADFGRALDVGDVNGDGFADVIVGAHRSVVDGLVYAGLAFVFLGPDLTNVFILQSPTPQANAHFGRTMGTGDLNNDGFVDIIVGAAHATVDDIKAAGLAFVFLGGSPFDPTADLTLQDPQPEEVAHFGRAMAVGDLNNDGIADLVISASRSDVSGIADAGQVFIFLGPAFTSPLTLEAPTPQAGVRFGRALTLGDVNADGITDLIAGAYRADVGKIKEAGQAFVFFGPDLMTTLTLSNPIAQTGAWFGRAVAARDITGDGVTDVIIGAPQADVAGAPDTGQVFIFPGPNLVNTFMVLNNPFLQAKALFGDPVAAGDIDGGGVANLVVGARGADVDGLHQAGLAFVFFAP